MQELTFEQVEVVSGGYLEVNPTAGYCPESPNLPDYSGDQAEGFWGAVRNAIKYPLSALIYSPPVGVGSEMPPICETAPEPAPAPGDTTLPGGGGEGLPKP
ncbi:MAG: hypothetical protein NWQ54_23870 [Paraglaciecola sp.]|nr:hypothetical protein [Paraglaciecola sp.]